MATKSGRLLSQTRAEPYCTRTTRPSAWGGSTPIGRGTILIEPGSTTATTDESISGSLTAQTGSRHIGDTGKIIGKSNGRLSNPTSSIPTMTDEGVFNKVASRDRLTASHEHHVSTMKYIILFIILTIIVFCFQSIRPTLLETSEPDSSVMRLIEDNDSSLLITSARDLILGKTKLEETPFELLDPENIEIYENSLKLTLNEAGNMENGIIVYTSYPAHIKEEFEKSGEYYTGGSGYSEHSIIEGIHWYWEKNRAPVR